MTLSHWGWTDAVAAEFTRSTFEGAACARVTEEHRDAYRLASAEGERSASLAGRLRYAAASAADLPCVGDWVVYTPFDPAGGLIHAVLPRTTVLARKAAGGGSHAQIIASNLDTVFIVTAPNQDFNVRRLERSIALVREGEIAPCILLNKSDLCEDTAPYAAAVADLGAPMIALSALQGEGFAQFTPLLEAGRTYAFIGTSGVGKSTLVNRLAGCDRLVTQSAREDDDRGRHTTTARCLVPLPGGALMIDTPGMREFGMLASVDGVAAAFDDIEELARDCRFSDCRHESEPGCAVRSELDPERLQNYRKLLREIAYAERKTDRAALEAYVRRFRQLTAGAQIEKRLKRGR